MLAALLICGGLLYGLLLFAYHIFPNKSIGQTRFVFRELVAETSNPLHVDNNAGLEYLGLNSQAAKENAELLENAIGLFGIEIRECLIPRNEIVAVELSESFESIKNTFVESKHSKLIVYENDIDNIIGYLHHSDFYEEKTDLSELVSEIPAVPETMFAVEMLTFFKKKQKSIAWVVDEFGGTAGILTTEDLLEELFGEIEDEHDQSEYIEQQISAQEFILSGRLEVEYINDKFDLEIPTESAETLSGYIIEVHNEIPEKDEKIIIDSYEYKILQVSKTRIETISLKIIEE
jgi:CBS domain containing-hemolysin-like protein